MRHVLTLHVEQVKAGTVWYDGTTLTHDGYDWEAECSCGEFHEAGRANTSDYRDIFTETGMMFMVHEEHGA
jgi:hypothetical protein